MQNIHHNHVAAMRKLCGPEHLAAAEVATAGFVPPKHSASSCGLLLAFSWRTAEGKSKVGIPLKLWVLNNVVMCEGGRAVCKCFHSGA